MFPVFPALALLLAASASAQSNLPPVEPGVFNASTHIEINAPLELVFDTILDFAKYPEWNPFVRSQVVADPLFIPLKNQTAFEGARLLIQVQIPPLPLPVDASTPVDLLHAQFSFENVTLIDRTLHRAAWRQIGIPSFAIDATRFQAVSAATSSSADHPVTLYESIEVYNGGLAPVLKDLFGEGLQEAFVAQGVALKARAEGLASAARGDA